ncbi:unnamed protein product [Taenia asiatica]|uniref:Secreted protein n=1 Tax=Taenia asiatica TaxID=60517 RepID=A0A0R3WD77_TAEAS|nr:unnamed protein product [Taenia asiatica]
MWSVIVGVFACLLNFPACLKVVGEGGVKDRSDVWAARPLAPAIAVPLNLPVAMPVVPMSAASVGLSTGLSAVAVKPSSSNLCIGGKAETLCVIGTLSQLPMKASQSSGQAVSSPPSGTSESVAQRSAGAPCSLMCLELAKKKSASTSSGGCNLLISRKTLDSSIANTLLRMRQLPVVGRTSAPEAGGCNVAPGSLKLAPNVEQKVVWSVAPTVAQVSTALPSTGYSAGQAESVDSVAKMGRRVASGAAQPTKSLENGVAGLLKCGEMMSSDAESSDAVVGGACSVSLQSVASAQSAVQWKGTEVRPRGEKSRGSVGSGVSTSWRRPSASVSALLPSISGMVADIVNSSRKSQPIDILTTMQQKPSTAPPCPWADPFNPASFFSPFALAHGDGRSGDAMARDVVMCPICAFSSCDREAIMRHVIDNH